MAFILAGGGGRSEPQAQSGRCPGLVALFLCLFLLQEGEEEEEEEVPETDESDQDMEDEDLPQAKSPVKPPCPEGPKTSQPKVSPAHAKESTEGWRLTFESAWLA